MAEPFDTLAAELAEIIKAVAAGTMSEADAALALIPLLSGLAPVQWEQLAKVIQVLGRVEGQLFTDGPPADTLGAIGSTAIDMTAKIFYGPKTSEGWGEGEAFVGATGPSGTITSVTTETTAVGTDAAVIAGGTPQARTLHFQIPDTVDTAVALFDMMGRADLYGITLIGAAARFAASGIEALFSSDYYRVGLLVGDEPADLTSWAFSRSGAGTALAASGAVEHFATGVPRITDKGLLVESARTNLILHSQEFDNAVWLLGQYTVTPNAAVAPDGTTTADALVTGDVSGSPSVYIYGDVPFPVSAGDVSAAIWVKADSVSQVQQRLICAGVTVLFTPTSTWTRIELGTAWAGGSMSFVVSPNVANPAAHSFFIWGAQVEAGEKPSSYIPTTTAQVTRAADRPEFVGANEGTYLIEGVAPPVFDASISQTILAACDAATSNSYAIFAITNGNVALLRKPSGGAGLSILATANTLTAGQPFKAAFSFGEDGTDRVCLNGGTVVEGASATIPYANTEARVGWWDSNPLELNGYADVVYLPTRADAATLQDLTT